MRKARGFKLGRRVCRVFKWVLRRPNRKTSGYQQLGSPNPYYKSKTMTKIYNWGKCLKRGAKQLCCSKRAAPSPPPKDYIRLGHEPFQNPKHVSVPKGHLAVYVGDKDDDYHRVLVPVFYFNHPLFGELLREAEKEYGFEHPGGITIPCQISEFENVKTRIAAGEICRKRR
ncbi:Auxin-induced protein [Macleaya cordata]|uniref:Auxin-induced protein n=1 Tax=Macleaya cordata TaxID=56857 RepID=A0A200QCG0_MACCD|nr:Auxin-induced protein [Macleaya cordata]